MTKDTKRYRDGYRSAQLHGWEMVDSEIDTHGEFGVARLLADMAEQNQQVCLLIPHDSPRYRGAKDAYLEVARHLRGFD